MENNNKPTVWAGVSHKARLGNGDSLEISFGVAGVEVGATEEQVEAAMDTIAVALVACFRQLKQQIMVQAASKAASKPHPPNRSDDPLDDVKTPIV